MAITRGPKARRAVVLLVAGVAMLAPTACLIWFANRTPRDVVFEGDTDDVSYGVVVSAERNTARIFIRSKSERPLVMYTFGDAYAVRFSSTDGTVVEYPDLSDLRRGPNENDWSLLGDYVELSWEVPMYGAPKGGTIELIVTGQGSRLPAQLTPLTHFKRVMIPPSTRWKLR